MTFSFAIVSNIATTTLEIVNKVEAKIWGSGVLEFKQTTQFDFFLLIDLYKWFLKFVEHFPKNGRTISNFLLSTVGTIFLGTENFSNHFLLTGQSLNLKILFRCSTSIWEFSILELILKTGIEACGLNCHVDYHVGIKNKTIKYIKIS